MKPFAVPTLPSLPASLASLIPLALAAAALTCGCASAPDRYYTLASTPASAAAPLAEGASPMAIELAPVVMPERLARAQMVVRKNAEGSELRVLEQHRWATSFEIELRDALASGIASRLGAVDASRRAQPRAWRIAVQVRQFDAVESSRVDAAFNWNIRRPESDVGLTCAWRTSEPAGTEIATLATSAQRATAGLAEAVARQVRAMQADPKAACVG